MNVLNQTNCDMKLIKLILTDEETRVAETVRKSANLQKPCTLFPFILRADRYLVSECNCKKIIRGFTR